MMTYPSEGGALFSPCRRWRYALWRTWEAGRGMVAFIGLNPSTADETRNDPTVTRCIHYAQRWGYGGMYMLNIFAYRATDPRAMMAQEDPEGPENDRRLWEFSEASDRVVACWGAHGKYRHRGRQVMNLLSCPLYCLGLTKEGHPRHPLYLRRDILPVIMFETHPALWGGTGA